MAHNSRMKANINNLKPGVEGQALYCKTRGTCSDGKASFMILEVSKINVMPFDQNQA